MSDRGELERAVLDARQRTLALVADLVDEQLRGPRLAVVNPLLWEIGHVAWFQELWVLRHALGEAPIRADGDALWDSSAVAHDTRWDLPLPPRPQTLRYMAEVCDRVRDRLGRPDLPAALAYFARYTTFHEDMHDEAFTYTRQTLGYRAPALRSATSTHPRARPSRLALSRVGGSSPHGKRRLWGASERPDASGSPAAAASHSASVGSRRRAHAQ